MSPRRVAAVAHRIVSQFRHDRRSFAGSRVPGGMLFDDRWVYFCLTINWYAKAETDGETVKAFAAAGSRALTMVKEALSV